MNNALKLPSWTVQTVTEQAEEYVIAASYDIAAVCCVHCGSTEKVYKHGTKQQRLFDIPTFGKRTIIDVRRLRYMCRDCNRTFLQPMPDVAESGSMTKRLREYIERQSLKHTFAHVAGEVGIDEKTVRNVFNEYVDWLDKTVVFETPRVLGLDETYLLGKPRCVVTNIELGTMVGVLEDRNKPTLHEYLFWLKDKDKVEIVTMDMWRPYREAVNAILPKAKVVVDKFHIVRMATQALESVRRGLRNEMTPSRRRAVMRSRFLALKRNHALDDEQRADLAEWMNTLPQLGKAYLLKEGFYAIFDLKVRAEAVEAYRKWELDMPDDMRPAFAALTTAMRNWGDEVFDIIEYGFSNAVTEALNGLTKIINRNGRGYSFKAIRAKMLYNRFTQRTPTTLAAEAKQWETMEMLTDHPESESATSDALFTREHPPTEPSFGSEIGFLDSVLIEEEMEAAAPPHPTPRDSKKPKRK